MLDLTAASGARLPLIVRAVAYPDSEEKLIRLVMTLSDLEIPYKVVGGMTNLLVKNGEYDGVVVKTDKIKTKHEAENELTLGCGVRMASRGLGGMEGLAGIPGTVGGMVKQNAGAFGYEISDRFLSARCYLPESGKTVVFSRDDMAFSYRHSALSDSYAVLLSATFEPTVAPPKGIVKRINELREQRLRSQPIDYPSLGSVFKRHNGISAGFYIDRAGLKGASVGGAQVSRKHAGFIINRGGATSDDFLRLIELIKERGYADFSVELKEEIEII